MQSKATTPDQYISDLPEEKKQAVEKLRKVILENLPEGFTETMSYGMIGYVVPYSLYPPGYHCKPKQPLPFINLASQKDHIALYHMGLYFDAKLLEWFTKEYGKVSKTKPDVGKSCIRFRKPDQIPFELIAKLMNKITVKEYVKQYEAALKSK
jgi:uncharacterized protein YdhG (YjbR/CyaY superfamily)